MSKDKAFKILIKDLFRAYQEFYLNRIIHKRVGGKFYSKFSSTWNTILISLEKSYLLGLARVFDKQFDRLDEPKRTISIYYFLDYKFIKHYETINKLKKLRNKILAHLDVEKMLDLEKFLKSLNFKSDRSDIESLFDVAIESLDEIKENFEFTWNLKQYFNWGKEDTRNKFDEWFKVFQQGI